MASVCCYGYTDRTGACLRSSRVANGGRGRNRHDVMQPKATLNSDPYEVLPAGKSGYFSDLTYYDIRRVYQRRSRSLPFGPMVVRVLRCNDGVLLEPLDDWLASTVRSWRVSQRRRSRVTSLVSAARAAPAPAHGGVTHLGFCWSEGSAEKPDTNVEAVRVAHLLWRTPSLVTGRIISLEHDARVGQHDAALRSPGWKATYWVLGAVEEPRIATALQFYACRLTDSSAAIIVVDGSSFMQPLASTGLPLLGSPALVATVGSLRRRPKEREIAAVAQRVSARALRSG